MKPTEFGKIALIVNEFGNLKHGEVTVNYSGELVIQYRQVCQTVEPCDLINLIAVKQNEYSEELDALVLDRDTDDAPTWRERNLRSYIGYLVEANYKLGKLHTFQKETVTGGTS